MPSFIRRLSGLGKQKDKAGGEQWKHSESLPPRNINNTGGTTPRDANGSSHPVTQSEATKQSEESLTPRLPSGSKRFGSFTGKFGRALWGKSGETPLQNQNFSTMTQEQLIKLADSMGKELDALYKAVGIMNKLAVEIDVYKATDNIRSFVLELLNCESVTLFLLDNENHILRARVKLQSGKWTIIQTAVGEGIAGKVAQTGASMNIADAYACKIFNPAIDKATNFKTKSLLCCPIADISGKHVAVIQAVNKLAGTCFSTADEANLELFGVHLGNTLTKSRLYASIMFEKQRLEKLNEGIREINIPFSTLDNLVTAINRSAYSVLLAEQTLLFFVDQARNQLWSRWEGCSGDGEPKTTPCATATLDAGLISQAFRTGEAQSCREAAVAAIGLGKGILAVDRVKCALVQPILDIRSGKALAMMVCINKLSSGDAGQAALFTEPKYTVNDLNVMSVFAIEVARVLSERSLEISFANALSSVASGVGEDDTVLDLEAALQAQLLSYAGVDEIESVAGSLKIPDSAIPPEQLHRRTSLKQPSPSTSLKKDARPYAKQLSLSDSLEKQASVPLRNTLRLKSQRLRQWELDIHYSSKEDLMIVAFDIFVDAGVLGHFNVGERAFMMWISKVASHYRDNPYHNFQHVVHVLHAVYMILMTTEASKCLTRVDQLALLIAALCHDIDHDGKTNGFHVSTASDLARCYNDNSVLENHHCALTYDLISKCELLNHLEKPVQLEMRRTVIGAILATDMSAHFSLTTDFKNHDTAFSHESPEDRMLLCKTILHAADLSNPTLPFAINSYISQNVHREFKMQVQSEIAQGITPMPHMNAKDERVQCLLEISFIDAVVVPLWDHLALLFPSLRPCMEQIHKNREGFQKLTTRRTHSIKEEMRATARS